MLEFKDWDRTQTDKWYPNGTKIAYVSLGEGAYGLILVTPWQSIYLEEIPLYGGEPQYWDGWCGSVEEAVEFIKKEWT
jgi:hypothetical protein